MRARRAFRAGMRAEPPAFIVTACAVLLLLMEVALWFAAGAGEAVPARSAECGCGCENRPAASH